MTYEKAKKKGIIEFMSESKENITLRKALPDSSLREGGSYSQILSLEHHKQVSTTITLPIHIPTNSPNILANHQQF